MSQTAVLVWLSASAISPGFRADLDGFAQSRLLRLEAPRENASAFRAPAYAPDIIAQVEVLLEEARNATASLEQSRALAALERAERLLHEHPELPQAAWLMAEQLELTADVEDTAPDGASASAALRGRAAALEGPRATPFSDHEPGIEPAAPALHAVNADGLEAGDTLEWDGVRTDPLLSTASGEHHARVSRNGRLLWAGWVSVGESELRVRLPVPETPACSSDDVGAGHFVDGRAIAAPRARCESYVLARGRVDGGIDAALCEREICGRIVIWEPATAHNGSAGGAERAWPRWATYTIAASAGLLATGLVLWRAGVFDRPAAGPATTSYFYMGQQKPMGFRF
jgi:hypothetical protein